GRGPGSHQPVDAGHDAFGGELRQLRLDRIEPCMPAERGEAELVEPASYGGRVVPVQVEELHAVVAERGNGAQRAFEVPCSVLAHGVEHQADARHATSAPLRCAAMKLRYQ